MSVFRSGCLLALLFLAHSSLTLAQSTAAAKASVSPAHPTLKTTDETKEGVVIERFVSNLVFEADGTSTREVLAVARVQAESGVKELAVLSFAYTSDSETVDVDYVRVRKPDGTVVNTPAYNIQDMPADLTRQAPMYSDIHEKHITVKALSVGDTLEYLVRFRTVKPEIPGQFWYEHTFTKAAISKDEQLKISVPKDKYVNVSSTDLQPTVTEEGNRRIYSWKTANLEREVPNENEIPKREVPRPSVEISTFRSWGEVGQWYSELQKSQIMVTPAVQAKANELTKGLTTDEEKVRALYNYVATHFHYVSLSFGIGRYQPHSADDVLGNEYGDCKDKHTLLATMLKAVGIDVWPVLINSSRKIDSDIPSPAAFDHVITAVPQGNKLVWLDTTTEVAPYGLIFTTLRGKKALVIPTHGEPSLMVTSTTVPFPFVQSFEAAGKLDSNGTFTGHVQLSARGDTEVLYRIGFRQVSQAQWKDLTQRISYSLGFGGDVSEVIATAPEDTSKPFQFSYDYTRKKYADWDNHRITPPMPPMGVEVAEKDERRPVEPFLLGAPGEVVYRAKVELPSFSKAKAPDNVDVVDDFAEYHSRYTIKDGVLTAERRLVIRKSEVELTSWDRYTKFRKTIMDDENHWIDLDGPATDSTSAENDNSEAARKYKEAIAAWDSRDFEKIGGLLRKVIELDPKYPRAHLALGQLYFSQNKMEQGLDEMRKEEEVNPEFKGTYAMMAFVLTNLGRKDEALEQWKKLLKVDPSSQDAALHASGALVEAKKYNEAIVILEASTKASPENRTLQLRLGSAYLMAGQKEKGVEIIQKAIADDADADSLNSAAWELCEANVNLELAKKYAEESIKKILASTGGENSDAAELTRTNQLGPSWDTLGWIYFRMGNLPKAASYLKAAWVLSQFAITGDHLAQVYQKQGKRQEAEHLYLLALAVSPLNASQAAEFREHYKQLTGKLPSGQYSTHRLPDGTWSPTPSEELSRMRTVKVAKQPSPGFSSATFSLMLAPGKVESVKFVSGSEELKPIAEKVKTAKFDVPVPDDSSNVRLARRGILTCGSTGCDFTLLLPQNAIGNQYPGSF